MGICNLPILLMTLYIASLIPSLKKISLMRNDLIRAGIAQSDRMIGVRIPAGAGNFSLRHSAHPASYPMGTREVFPLWVKRPGSEGDHSPPSSADVNAWGLYLYSPNTPSWCHNFSPPRYPVWFLNHHPYAHSSYTGCNV